MCGTQIKIVPIYFLELELKVLHKSKEPPQTQVCNLYLPIQQVFRQFKWLISATYMPMILEAFSGVHSTS
jgi:hypothetical protein